MVATASFWSQEVVHVSSRNLTAHTSSNQSPFLSNLFYIESKLQSYLAAQASTRKRCRGFRSSPQPIERAAFGSQKLAGLFSKNPLPLHRKCRRVLQAQQDSSTFADSTTQNSDSIADTLESLQPENGSQEGAWSNLAPQGSRVRLVDKALTRLLREMDDMKVVAYLDHWEGSLDTNCVLQLMHEMGERKALSKLQLMLDWFREQQWTPQDLASAYQTVLETAEALTKSDVIVQLCKQMQEVDHVTPTPKMYESLAQALIRMGEFQAAYGALLKLKELGADLMEGDESVLGALLFRVSNSPNGGVEAVSILQKALADGLPIDTRMVTSVLIGLQKQNPPGLAEITQDVAAALKAKGVQLDRFAYRVILTTYRRTEALSKLRDTLHAMEEEEGFEPNVENYRYLIPKLSSENLAEEAFAETRRLQEKGVAVDGWIFRSCMYACCRAGLCDMAANLYQDLLRAGFEPTLTQFNYLMGAFAKAGRKAEALRFYEEMLECNLRPNAVTYGTLIDMARPDLPKVQAWYERMKEDGVQTDRAVYHLMIDALATNGKVDAAFELLNEMEQALEYDRSGLKATPYVALASAFAVADRLEESVDILQRMKSRNMVVTTQNLVTVFQAASQKSGVTVSMLLRTAEQKGLPLSPAALTEIAGLFRRQGAVGAAWEVAKKLKAQEPTLARRSFVEIMNIHSKKGEWVDAQVTFDRMLKAGIRPQPNDWTTLLAAYAKGIEYDKAVAVFERMIASGERPDTDKYNVLIDACIRAERSSEVTRWLAEMKERRVPFDAITFNMVIGAYASRGDVRATEFTYRKMLDNGHTPSRETYHYLIKASIAGGYFEQAPVWLEEMRKRGIDRDTFTYNTLIRGYAESRRMQELEVVVGDLLQSRIPPDHITYELLFGLANEGGDRLARLLFASLKRFLDREALSEQYNMLLMALMRKHRWPEVELVVDQAHEEGMQLDKRTFESAIERMALAKKLTMAINMFYRMRTAMPHLVPREFAFMPLLHSFAKRRQWKQAADLLSQLKEAGVPCRAASHHKVLSIMEASQQWEAIAELYASIRGEEFVKEDKGILMLVMRAAQVLKARRHPGARELAQELYEGLRAFRERPERPPKVGPQKVAAGKLWKRGMGFRRSRKEGSSEEGSNSEEDYSSDEEAYASDEEFVDRGGSSETHTEAEPASGRSQSSGSAPALKDKTEQRQSLGKGESSRPLLPLGAVDSSAATAFEGTGSSNRDESLNEDAALEHAESSSSERENHNGGDRTISSGASESSRGWEGNGSLSPAKLDGSGSSRVARLEKEDATLEVLERSSKQDEVLEGVLDTINRPS